MVIITLLPEKSADDMETLWEVDGSGYVSGWLVKRYHCYEKWGKVQYKDAEGKIIQSADS
jgi:hypothetical protein